MGVTDACVPPLDPAPSRMRRHVWIRIPWATLVKIALAVAAAWLWQQLIWTLMLVMIAVMIAVGLAPVVAALERRGCPRWLAASGLVVLIVATIVGFGFFTYASLSEQSTQFGERLNELEEELMRRAPQPVLDALRGGGNSGGQADSSMLAPYAMRAVRGTAAAIAAFVLAWILVVYLLIEAEPTYAWIRGFVPAPHRRRFDATAAELREVALGFVVGNITTSTCAAIYFFVWLSVLGVPGALLLAVMAFIFDFIPVLGFYLSCLPAMAMAATQSTTLMVTMIPIYLSYDVIENYLIAPRVYGNRLNLSKVAVLLAFVVGGQLGGIVGAVIALPIAASYPTIERHWLRRPFGDDVADAHEALEERQE